MIKLCLGTVQLGMKYGIRNEKGDKPSRQESIEILKRAYEIGIRYFDTASAYGDSEKIIRDSGIAQEQDCKIITKINCPLKENIREEVKQSLDRLGVNQVDGILLHEPSKYYEKDYFGELLKIKQLGMTSHVGVSVYEPSEAIDVAKNHWVDYIQIPYSVLDQRLDDTPFFSMASKNSIKVFARSVFLQGLILFDENEIPKHLISAKPYIKKVNMIAKKIGFTSREAAFLFAYSHKGINELAFGVDDICQLERNVDTLLQYKEFAEHRNKFVGISKGIDKRILNPGLWEELVK